MLSNKQVARIETGKGVALDIPLSGISMTKVSALAGILSLRINGKIMQLKLKTATYFDPVLLYSLTSPMVSSIQG